MIIPCIAALWNDSTFQTPAVHTQLNRPACYPNALQQPVWECLPQNGQTTQLAALQQTPQPQPCSALHCLHTASMLSSASVVHSQKIQMQTSTQEATGHSSLSVRRIGKCPYYAITPVHPYPCCTLFQKTKSNGSLSSTITYTLCFASVQTRLAHCAPSPHKYNAEIECPTHAPHMHQRATPPCPVEACSQFITRNHKAILTTHPIHS
jgi:hypothetical protein